MKFLTPRILTFVFLSSLLLSTVPEALASKGREDREVRIVFVQGDVRISRGHDHHPDLNQPWEQAQNGEFVEQGCALATGNGRAEIEFENGSTVYLAENSVLLFRDLSSRAPGEIDVDVEDVLAIFLAKSHLSQLKELLSPSDRIVSGVTLATGTATFALQPAANEYFVIETPTDTMHLTAPESFFARVDSYLDATAITPQGEKGEHVVWRDMENLQLPKGKTLFLQDGAIVQLPPRESSVDPWELVLQGLPDFQIPPMAHTPAPRRGALSDVADNQAQGAGEWDTWVSTRWQKKSAVTAAALKASGLSSPISGLADLYEHGAFFSCDPYGTCWEATDPDDSLDYTPQSAVSGAQAGAAAQNQANISFQPQTVQWEELWQGWCSPPTLRTVTRVAHTPEELQKLLHQKEAADKVRYSSAPVSYSLACENGFWIHHRRHYARVVTPRLPRHCLGSKCKPIHAPRPVWVRAAGKVGFVPAHPNDVKGKPPLNLKNGIFAPPAKPGEPVRRIDWDPSQKVKLLDKAPREFQAESFARALPVSAPVIRAHLLNEAGENNSRPGSMLAVPPIKYDYASHHFVMAASAVAGGKSLWEVSTPMGESEVLLTAALPLIANLSLVAKPLPHIAEALSAHHTRSDRPILPEDAIPAIPPDRTRPDPIIRAPARPVAVPRTPRAQAGAEGPSRAPAVQAHQVRAVRVVVRAADRKEGFGFLRAQHSALMAEERAHFRKKSFLHTRPLGCDPRKHPQTWRI